METTLNSLDVVAGLESIGFQLSTDGENLTVDGPTETLDNRRCDLIRHFKSEIVTHLLGCKSEREAIVWADSGDPDADEALNRELAYWDSIEVVEPGTIDREFEALPMARDCEFESAATRLIRQLPPGSRNSATTCMAS